MRAWLRFARHVLVLVGVVSFLSGAAWADPVYSVTNLGPANPSAAFLNGTNQLDPSGNYLGALSPADRAAFQAGSFDVFAHPANANLTNADQSVYNPTLILTDPAMATSNNFGENAGYVNEVVDPGYNYQSLQIGVFRPEPHTMDVTSETGVVTQIQSPGYLSLMVPGMSSWGMQGGTVAGVNDQGTITFSQSAGQASQNLMPYITGVPTAPGGFLGLGSLGGNRGESQALNRFDQVVGWSFTASGAQHAFVYSSGTMQDLNLLIPSSANITLIDAVGIDASSQIVAYGTDSTGRMEEFLLTPMESGLPVPEPSTLAVFGLMIAAVAAHHVRSRQASKR